MWPLVKPVDGRAVDQSWELPGPNSARVEHHYVLYFIVS